MKVDSPIRKKPMPARHALGWSEFASICRCVLYYKMRGEDPGYDGEFENRFTKSLAGFFKVPYADAVATGTGAIYVALKALKLPPRSLVATSPVTEASVVSCIIEQGHIPVLLDSDPGSYNISAASVKTSLTNRLSLNDLGAVIVTHAGGEPVEMLELMELFDSAAVPVIEDISQAIGATCNGGMVGTFGEFAVSSTMYRKNLSAGGASGFFISKNWESFKLARQFADRGKHWWSDQDLRDPGFSDFHALNWNTDEISCAIGLASLRRLEKTNEGRRKFLRELVNRMKTELEICYPYKFHDGFAPFYFPIMVDSQASAISAEDFGKMMQAEGIGIGLKYGCLVSTWPWATPHMFDDFGAPNALATRDHCFHLYVNEQYGTREINDVSKALKKVEQTISKR